MSDNLELRLFFNLDLTKPFREAKKDFLRKYLKDLIAVSLGNVSMAARRANLDRKHFYRIINDFELDLEEPRKEMLKPLEYMKESMHEHLPLEDLEGISKLVVESIEARSYSDVLELFERRYIAESLRSNGFDVQKTAHATELSERTLMRKIDKYSIAA